MLFKITADKCLNLFSRILSFILPAFLVRSIFDLIRRLKKNRIIFKLLYLYSGCFNKKYSSTFNKTDNTFKTFLNYKIVLPSSDSHFLKRSLGVYHPLELHNEIEKICIENNCKNFGEIGSHLGEMSLFLSSIFSDLSFKNHIFELDKYFCNYLNRSLMINNFSNTIINNCIIGSNKKISNNYYDQENFFKNFSNLRSYPIQGMKYFLKNDEEQKPEKVEEFSMSNPLDLKDYFKTNYVDFWFMDVEGSEIHIMPEILDLNEKFKKKPIIIFETHFERYNQKDIIDLKMKLKNSGYLFETIDNRHLICF